MANENDKIPKKSKKKRKKNNENKKRRRKAAMDELMEDLNGGMDGHKSKKSQFSLMPYIPILSIIFIVCWLYESQ